MNFNKIKSVIWEKHYLILTFILLLAVIFMSFNKPWPFTDDIWEHGAAIKEISIHPIHPSNPLIMLPGNTSPRFVPYTVFWGIIQRITGLDIFTLLGIIAIVNYFIFIRGLYLFVSTKFKDNLLPVYTLLVMLIVWGTGYELYKLGSFLISLTLPGYFAFALGLNALYYLIKYIDQKSIGYLVIYFILSVIIFISHPITSAFLFVLAFLIPLESNNFKELFILQIVPIVAFALSLLWPYFSYWDVFTKGTSGHWFRSPFYSNQISSLGFALIGIIPIIFYYFKKQHKFLFYSLSICIAVYTISYFLRVDIGDRFLLFAVFIMHLGLALYLKEIDLFSFKTIRSSLKNQGIRFILIFLFLIYPVRLRLLEIESYAKNVFDLPFKFHSYDSPVNSYLFLKKYLTSSDIVLTELMPSWPIPVAIGAKIVPLAHYDPLIINESEMRAKAVYIFFRANLELNERKQILLKYNVTHILVDEEDRSFYDSSFVNQIASLGTFLVKKDHLALYKVNDFLPIGRK
jgi:hypothetical protein